MVRRNPCTGKCLTNGGLSQTD
uniref:Uncharacterized protein n=1 Tax=Anguilla anguilla TaxID=7936 RepID=A0A0E9XYR0_ANGAN